MESSALNPPLTYFSFFTTYGIFGNHSQKMRDLMIFPMITLKIIDISIPQKLRSQKHLKVLPGRSSLPFTKGLIPSSTSGFHWSRNIASLDFQGKKRHGNIYIYTNRSLFTKIRFMSHVFFWDNIKLQHEKQIRYIW